MSVFSKKVRGDNEILGIIAEIAKMSCETANKNFQYKNKYTVY